jgi:histone chaperone ASF1
MHDAAQRRHHPLHLLQLVLDLEWKLVYVGSATSEAHDQVLDSILVGPVPVGVNKFIFEVLIPTTRNTW